MAHRIRSTLFALFAFGALAPSASAATVELASQAAVRAAAVSPNSDPQINAPAAVVYSINTPVNIAATATDADAGDLLTITSMGAPASLTFSHVPSVSPATASLTGVLGLGDVGMHSIQWTVNDGAGGVAMATTDLTVAENSPPIISAPAAVLGGENFETEVAITYSDPDGDPINYVSATPLPPGAIFTPNALGTGALFAWTPAVGQAGTYPITFEISTGGPAQIASAVTVFTINPLDHPCVISGAPGTANTTSDITLTLNLTVTDADGDPITSLTATGTQGTPLPAGALFTPNGTNTAATFVWTPTAAQVGTYSIDFKARSGALDIQTLVVTKMVVRVDRPPVVTAPANVTSPEGTLVQFMVTAADPDNSASTPSPIASLTMSGAPLGATFMANAANTSGTFSWTPNFNDAGLYNVTFTATNALSGSAMTAITITNQNRPPVANANGPYQGVAGVAIAFSGAGSSDPDGQPLMYAWDFGDGATATGSSASHTYASGGVYNVSLTVMDSGVPAAVGTDNTTATVSDGYDARVFTTGGNKTIRLNSGKPAWCAHIEPVNRTFPIGEVFFFTFRLRYGGNEIPAIASKTLLAGDDDNNGVQDVELCFAKEDLRTLFASLPSGKHTVEVEIAGNLTTGGALSGTVDVEVVASGGSMAASISPNPLNPSATLTFNTAKQGPVRVHLFDLSGRLVRTLVDWSAAAAGYHDVTVDGRSDSGEELGSGVYFFRIETAAGVESGRFTILR